LGGGGRFRAKTEQFQRVSGLLPERPGQNLALTVVFVPNSLDSGWGPIGALINMVHQPRTLDCPWTQRRDGHCCGDSGSAVWSPPWAGGGAEASSPNPRPQTLNPKCLSRNARIDTSRYKRRRGRCRVWGLEFGFQGSALRVKGLGFKVQGLGFRVCGLGFRVWVPGFRVQGLRFRV